MVFLKDSSADLSADDVTASAVGSAAVRTAAARSRRATAAMRQTACCRRQPCAAAAAGWRLTAWQHLWGWPLQGVAACITGSGFLLPWRPIAARGKAAAPERCDSSCAVRDSVAWQAPAAEPPPPALRHRRAQLRSLARDDTCVQLGSETLLSCCAGSCALSCHSSHASSSAVQLDLAGWRAGFGAGNASSCGSCCGSRVSSVPPLAGCRLRLQQTQAMWLRCRFLEGSVRSAIGR